MLLALPTLLLLVATLPQDSRPASRPIVAAGEDVIAFMRQGAVWVVRPDGTSERKLSQADMGFDRPIAWDAAGQRVLVWTDHAGWNVGAVDATTGLLSRLTQDGADNRMAQASPDGSRIAFMSGASGLLVMNADGTQSNVVAGFGHRDAAPAWSRDGTLLALTDLRQVDDRHVDLDVHIVRAGGGKPLLLVPSAEHPQWSADGRTFYVVARREGRRDVFAVGLEDGSERPLTADLAREDWLTASPDGSRLCFVAAEELVVIEADGSRRRVLARLRGRPQPPTWSPDGRHVAFASVPDGAAEGSPPALFTVEVATSRPTRLTKEKAGWLAWRPRGEAR